MRYLCNLWKSGTAENMSLITLSKEESLENADFILLKKETN
jgi:hypothetical protein